jgi:anti-sigma B factor antagonist
MMPEEDKFRNIDNGRKRPTVIIRIANRELSIFHLDENNLETDIARLQMPWNERSGGVDISSYIVREIEKDNRRFLFDLSFVESLNSTGIGWLIKHWKKIEQLHGNAVLIIRFNRMVEILKVTKLDELFQVRGSVEDGVHYLDESETQHRI